MPESYGVAGIAYHSPPKETQPLRIRWYVLFGKDYPYIIPILLGWDRNPKSPIRSGRDLDS